MRDLRGADRAFRELFAETIQNPARFLRQPRGFLRGGTPATAFLADFALPLPARRSRTACSEGGHTPRHPAPSPGATLPRKGAAPAPLSRAPVLRGRLRVERLDPILMLPVEWGESLRRIALPLARTELLVAYICILLFIKS